MIGEFERPVRRRAAQDRALARYLRTVVAPYSSRYGDLLRLRPITSVADLAVLPVTSISSERDVAELVLRPTAERIAASGDYVLAARLWMARATKRLTSFNRNEIEPAFKPIHWQPANTSGGLPIGSTATDLERLGEIGRTMLEMAGVEPYDVVIALQPGLPGLDYLQLMLGTRRAGIALLTAGVSEAPDRLAQLRPNVVAGRAADLLRTLEEGRHEGLSFAGLHTVIVFGGPVDALTRARLAEVAGTPSKPAAVVACWGAPGARAVWSECRDGTDVHTWPAAEVLEVVDPATGAPHPPNTDGEIVYTPLGWRGSVLLRMRTGVYGCLDDTPCVACGRTSPRVRLVPSLPAFARLLDEHPDVERWQAEMRTVDGAEELIVFLAPRRSGHPGRLLRELDEQLSVTQFVVLDREAIDERLRRSGDARVIDHRGEWGAPPTAER